MAWTPTTTDTDANSNSCLDRRRINAREFIGSLRRTSSKLDGASPRHIPDEVETRVEQIRGMPKEEKRQWMLAELAELLSEENKQFLAEGFAQPHFLADAGIGWHWS